MFLDQDKISKTLGKGLVSIFIAQMILNRKIIVKGSLERYRDFIHVDDVVGITKAIIDNPITYNKIYNVGTGIRTTVKSLLDQIIDLYGEKIEVVQSGSTPGDQLGITADISKLVAQANFKPKKEYQV